MGVISHSSNAKLIRNPDNEFQSARLWVPTGKQNVELFNPVGSGVKAIVTYMSIATNTAGASVAWSKETTAVGAQDTTYITNKDWGGAAPACEIYQGEDAVPSSFFMSLRIHNPPCVQIWSLVGHILHPGNGLLWQNVTAAHHMSYEITWQEVKI